MYDEQHDQQPLVLQHGMFEIQLFECEAVHHVISKYITLGNNEIKH